jgi:hypothetical protein
VGDPRFQANDFVIYDKLGSLNIRVVEQSSIQAALDETLRKETAMATISPKVNIYSATYESGKPFQGPVTVLLKEYTPDARHIGLNELIIADRLQVRFNTRASAQPEQANSFSGILLKLCVSSLILDPRMG